MAFFIGEHVFAFTLTLAALVLLALNTFSVPFISNFYFLDASASGGVKFGVWGWCEDDGSFCTPKTLGYTFDPEIIFWLTQTLVLYPISTGLTLLSLFSLFPTLCARHHERIYPSPVFSFFIFLSWLTSVAALAFMFALWITAMDRFHSNGFTATFGPLPWMSAGATAALTIVGISSGCGMMFGCRRVHRHIRYTV